VDGIKTGGTFELKLSPGDVAMQSLLPYTKCFLANLNVEKFCKLVHICQRYDEISID